MQTVEVEILGSIYHFKTDDPAHFKQLASHLKQELEALRQDVKTVDRTKLLVFYCLQLTEKYFSEKDSSSNLKKETEEIDHLLDDLEIDI
ncbi:MAG: cell division protein ZapA [Candidatus Cloacimonadales bacterium]